jgi:hypothetical protein
MAAVEDSWMLGRAFEPDFAAKPWCPTTAIAFTLTR